MKKKFRLAKILFNFLLVGALVTILFQNNQSVEVELLAWHMEISLTFLIIGAAFMGALITFITVLLLGK
jgi:uncharacterized integral membrane protein